MDEHIKQTLQAWHKIEYLTPHIVECDDDTIPVAKDTDLPWINPDRYNLVETDRKTFRHQVFIGVFDIEEMMSVVRDTFQDAKIDEQYNDYKVKSVFAEIIVEHSGYYRQGSFKVSTVPFVLGKLEREGAGRYEAWHQSYHGIELELQSLINRHFDGPVSYQTLSDLLQLLIEKLQWAPRFRKCLFWVKPDSILKPKANAELGNSEEQENMELPGILNSFYLRELESILQSTSQSNERLGTGIYEYLSSESIKQSERVDIDHNRDALMAILSPEHIPLGKWPGNDKHTLNLMQQAAVNQMFMKLSDQPGLFSVNGPPGTGKTTLLRDVIAAIIVHRAQQLVEYDNPDSAFSVKQMYNKYPLYSLDPKLCGYSIVIASSNNGAVENISMELPEKSAIDAAYLDHKGAAYFREVAQTINGSNNWGLIAAKLGRSSNRFKFFSKFWFKPNEDPGMSFKQWIDQAKEVRKKSAADPLKDWNNARKSFRTALENAESEQRKAVAIYSDVIKLHELTNSMTLLKTLIDSLTQQMHMEKDHFAQVREEIVQFQKQHDSKLQQWKYLCQIRFGLFQILFRRKKYIKVREQKNKLLSECAVLQESKHNLEEREMVKQVQLNDLTEQFFMQQKQLETEQKQFLLIQQRLKKEKTESDRIIMDQDFWEQPIDAIQKSSPWITEAYTKARSLLFLEALSLHECFIMMTHSKIIGNLYPIMNPNKIDYHTDKHVFPGIWDVFSLIVPVISSTFASFASMFKGMDAQTLGWLFVDEAGQAVPQAAVGAIWRAQRTVIVGDPLQIEPVITLPKAVLEDIASFYKVSDRFISLNSSVQTVADMANKRGTWIRGKWIGSPLWVHRRCISPMFDICNEIAYDGRMVLDTASPKQETIINMDRLGHNMWLQVEGASTIKQYVPEQARAVLRLIWKAFEPIRSGSCTEKPSLYVISPFAVVKNQLKLQIKEHYKTIAGSMSKSEYNKWVDQSVGTVHTFQGKQADAVIFCLGVDAKKPGAADWATSTVNLVNVAVSRAKYRFIVVGDKQVWASKEYMSTVNRLILADNVAKQQSISTE